MNNSRTLLIGGITGLVMMFGASMASAAEGYGDDRAMIEDLQARYLFALDFQDADSYAATFTEDGVLDYGTGEIKGRDAIAEVVSGMRGNAAQQGQSETAELYPSTGRHNITNIVIKVDGDTATSASYWFHVGNANEERNAQINSYGHYEDELVKVDGEWLFSKRKIYNEQVEEWIGGTENPAVNPGDGPGERAD